MRNAYLYTKSTFPATAVKIKKKWKPDSEGGKAKKNGKLKTQQKYKPQLVIKLVQFSQQTFTLTTRPTLTHTHTDTEFPWRASTYFSSCSPLHLSPTQPSKDFKRPIEA